MKGKNDSAKKESSTATTQSRGPDEITSKTDLRQFLTALKARMEGREIAPVYAFNAMQHIFNLPDVSALLDQENQDLAKAVWLKLKQAGVQLDNPPLLFPDTSDGSTPHP